LEEAGFRGYAQKEKRKVAKKRIVYGWLSIAFQIYEIELKSAKA
jgi:hypothetical protein